MKKIFLFVLVTCVTTSAMFAQISGGLKAGLNLSKQKWEVEFMGQSGSDKLEGVGFHVGGYLLYAINEKVTLQPELIYNSLKVDQDGTELTTNYLSLPIMFGYGFENNKLILQAGPQIGYMISADPSEIKDDDGLKDIDLSFNLGAMVNLGKFNLGVRYCIGLMNIAGETLEEEVEAAFGEDIDISIKNSNLQFSVGYTLFGN